MFTMLLKFRLQFSLLTMASPKFCITILRMTVLAEIVLCLIRSSILGSDFVLVLNKHTENEKKEANTLL